MNVKEIKKRVKDEISKVCGDSRRCVSLEEAPSVEINNTEFIDSTYSIGEDRWDACKLYQFAKDKGYNTFDMPIAGINLASKPWTVTTFIDFLEHAKRINKCTFNNPILLDDEGYICDGWHRLAKAILDGHKYIKAIRLETMPEPSNSK